MMGPYIKVLSLGLHVGAFIQFSCLPCVTFLCFNFLTKKFEVVCCSQPSTSSVKEASRQRCRTEIYNHFTCATDTEGIKVVFDAVIDLVIFMNILFFCNGYFTY